MLNLNAVIFGACRELEFDEAGSIFVIFAQSAIINEVVGALAACLTYAVQPGGGLLFDQVVVWTPSTSHSFDSTVVEGTSASFHDSFRQSRPQPVATRPIDIEHAGDLFKIIQSHPARSAIIVFAAHEFVKCIKREPAGVEGGSQLWDASQPETQQDFERNLAEVGRALRDANALGGRVVFLVTTREDTFQSEDPEFLAFADNFMMFKLTGDSENQGEDAMTGPSRVISALMATIQTQPLEEALQEIERASLDATDKSRLRAQAYMYHGAKADALNAMAPLIPPHSLDAEPYMVVAAANLAQELGENVKTDELLDHALARKDFGIQELLALIHICSVAERTDDAVEVAHKVLISMPDSLDAMCCIALQLWAKQDWQALRALTEGIGPKSPLLDYCQRASLHFEHQRVFDVHLAFISDVEELGEELVVCSQVDVARALLAEGRAREAGLALSGRLNRNGIWIAMRVLEQLLIAPSEHQGDESDGSERHRKLANWKQADSLVDQVLAKLAGHPEFGPERAHLQRRLTEAESGTFATLKIHTLLERSLKSRPSPVTTETLAEPVAPHIVGDWMQAWIDSRRSATGISLEPKILFEQVIPDNLPGLITQLLLELSSSDALPVTDESVNGYLHLFCAALDCGATQALDNPALGALNVLRAFRIAAQMFATAGRPQIARDTVESMIHYSARERLTGAHLRFVWVTFSDIYARLQNSTDAVIGLALSEMVECEILSFEDCLAELELRARLFRDMGMLDEAIEALDRAAPILGSIDPASRRLDVARLQLSLSRVRTSDNHNETLQRHVDQAFALLREVDGSVSDFTVRYVLLVELYGAYLRAGGDVNEEVETYIEQLRTRKDAPSIVNDFRFTLDYMDARTLTTWCRSVAASAFRADSQSDSAMVRLQARRALSQSTGTISLQLAFVALEIQTDSSFRHDGWRSDNEGSSLLDGPEELNECALGILKRGCNFIFRGTDSDNWLCEVVGTPGGQLRFVRHECAIDRMALMTWNRRYPYEFGLMEELDQDITGPERMLASMQNFVTTGFDQTAPCIVFSSTPLAIVPANLWLVEGAKAVGESGITCLVPSLTWLRQTWTKLNRPHKRSLWMFDDVGALGMLRDYILDDCSSHGFEEVQELPADGSVLIIGAHGGLDLAELSFSSLGDEEVARLHRARFAERVGAHDLVVLLVCSGGRVDRDFADSLCGLAHDLLRNGVRTVIASPWPIGVNPSARWLSYFLPALDKGANAVFAAFEANERLAKLYPHPKDSLAFHVYGDPFLTVASRPA